MTRGLAELSKIGADVIICIIVSIAASGPRQQIGQQLRAQCKDSLNALPLLHSQFLDGDLTEIKLHRDRGNADVIILILVWCIKPIVVVAHIEEGVSEKLALLLWLDCRHRGRHFLGHKKPSGVQQKSRSRPEQRVK